jgi:hypothetical protein
VWSHEAGPAVLDLLRSPEPDIRVAAAETLGFIEYRPGVPALQAALADPDDWRLAYVAAMALGRLRPLDPVAQGRLVRRDRPPPTGTRTGTPHALSGTAHSGERRTTSLRGLC